MSTMQGLLWIAFSVAAVVMAYKPIENPGMPMEHYSRLAQLSIKNEVLFTALLWFTNFCIGSLSGLIAVRIQNSKNNKDT